MRFDGDIIITDPCYVIRTDTHDDTWEFDEWRLVEHGSNMEVVGITNYLVSDTIYGDWGCTTFKGSEEDCDYSEPIGEFCADAGLVSVFLLEDILKYNPEFDYHLTKPWTTTLIKDFHGEIEILVKQDENGDDYVTVVGEGNINFFTAQTSL